jgi:RNA polymerase sigma-70 factor (ECF subfamily)
MTGDAHGGEDVAQEAFARVFARRKDWQPAAKFSTWLWRIALNLCYDELRRTKRRRESPLEDDADEGAPMVSAVAVDPTPDEVLAERERGEQVRGAVMKLNEPYRTVLVLRHYENLKFREIAELLEVPEGTVKSRMAEALAQLSRRLAPMMKGEMNLKKPTAKSEERMLI